MEDSPPQTEKKSAPVFETTWLEGVVEMNWKRTPDGGVIISYILGNGHRYCLPLLGQTLEVTRTAVSPIAVVGANEMPPNNGHQA